MGTPNSKKAHKKQTAEGRKAPVVRKPLGYRHAAVLTRRKVSISEITSLDWVETFNYLLRETVSSHESMFPEGSLTSFSNIEPTDRRSGRQMSVEVRHRNPLPKCFHADNTHCYQFINLVLKEDGHRVERETVLFTFSREKMVFPLEPRWFLWRHTYSRTKRDVSTSGGVSFWDENGLSSNLEELSRDQFARYLEGMKPSMPQFCFDELLRHKRNLSGRLSELDRVVYAAKTARSLFDDLFLSIHGRPEHVTV